MLGLSQQQLADSLGLTFQQVQKYERGANRVSASKLYETACFLKVPMQYFFDGLDGEAAGIAGDAGLQAVSELLMLSEGVELAAKFPRIKQAVVRRSLLDLIQRLREEDEASGA